MVRHLGDRLEIKSNKTIVGLRAGTQLKAAIHVNAASNVILRNIVVRGPGSNDDQAWDNINIEGSSKNIWIDHCEFWDGQDGNADVVKGADTVTFTWSIFGYALSGHTHNLSNLIASSDSEPESEGKLDITYMFNWWSVATERQPRCRYGYIHVVNNLYTASASVGASKLGRHQRVLVQRARPRTITSSARTRPSTSANRPAPARFSKRSATCSRAAPATRKAAAPPSRRPTSTNRSWCPPPT